VFNTRGDALATSDSRGNVYIFRLTKNRYERLQNVGTDVSCLCFSTLRKSELFVACGNGKVLCFDIDSRRLLKTLASHRHPVHTISFHPFKALMTTSSVESLAVWDLKQWKKIRSLGAGSGVIKSIFTPDGNTLLIAFRDDSVIGWSTDTFEITLRFEVPPRLSPLNITTISSSPDGRLVMAGGKRRELMVWKLASQEPLLSVQLPTSVHQIIDLEFLPDSGSVSVLADDGRVRFVEISLPGGDGGCKPCPIAHQIARRDRAVLKISQDVSAKFAACCLSDGSLLLYDLEIARNFASRIRTARVNMGTPRDEAIEVLTSIGAGDLRSRSPPRKGGRTNAAINLPSSESRDRTMGTTTAPPASTAAIPGATVPSPEDGPDKAAEASNPFRTVTTAKAAVGSAPQRPVENKDEAYWLEQSVPVTRGQAMTSRLVDSAFGKSEDVATTRVVNEQRRAARQRRKTRHELTPAANPVSESRLSRPRLAKLLRTYGRFPSKYRLTVWKFLLNVPGNTAAFEALCTRGIHPRFSDLELQWPVRDQRAMRNFQRILSALAHWSQVFADLPYLPYLVFPFVMVFKSDLLGAFETVMSVLVHWSGDWFETYPHPPIPQLSCVERLLGHHDVELLEDFKTRGIDSRQYAWQMMRTLFSQVLTEDEWLVLFDHLFTHSDHPSLLLVAIAAYLMYFRSSIMAARSADDVLSFLRRQNPINMQDFVKLIFETRSRTPNNLFPSSSQETDPAFPLPDGQYPVFERYPKYVVDFQLQERARIAEEERSIKETRTNLAALQRQSKELAEKEHLWRQQQEEFLRSEKERLSNQKARDERLQKERVALAKLTEERRLRQVALKQQTLAASLEFQEQAIALEETHREQELARRFKQEEAILEERKKEEEILSLEYQTMIQLRDQQTKRSLDEQLKALRAEFIARDTTADLEAKREEQGMQLEDEYRTKMIETQTEQAALLARQAELEKLRRALESKEALAQLDRDKKLVQVKRQRMLRRAEETAAHQASIDHEARVKRERLLLAEEARQERISLAQHKQWRSDQSAARGRILAAEERRRIVETELREARLRELEQLQRDRDLEEALLARRGDDIKDVLAEESALQETLASIEAERVKDRRIEMQLLARENELKKKVAMEHVLRAADERLVIETRTGKSAVRSASGDGASEQQNGKSESTEALASRAQRLLDASNRTR
jgi:hypothetical protein